eukprot:344457-Pyramimonas_sp.AAC.1
MNDAMVIVCKAMVMRLNDGIETLNAVFLWAQFEQCNCRGLRLCHYEDDQSVSLGVQRLM